VHWPSAARHKAETFWALRRPCAPWIIRRASSAWGQTVPFLLIDDACQFWLAPLLRHLALVPIRRGLSTASDKWSCQEVHVAREWVNAGKEGRVHGAQRIDWAIGWGWTDGGHIGSWKALWKERRKRLLPVVYVSLLGFNAVWTYGRTPLGKAHCLHLEDWKSSLKIYP
jgi:hypothetical protein